MGNIESLRFRTQGMHCPSCSLLVDMMVGELDGVQSVSSDHVTGEISIEVDTDRSNRDAVVSAIRKAGYEPELIA
ncbi:MAG: heavy-metal-associated domain-containing protein [Actinobacteria bacterium]|nr:heavy-metal-associated domain-containing protein [Actinomycetota bacterium]